MLNNSSGTALRIDTLTIDGGTKTSTSEFSGNIVDTDLTRFPTANPNLRTWLIKIGATTQILSGNSSYSGPTSAIGGVIALTGILSNTSALNIGAGGRFENLGSLTVTGNITNDGTMLLTSDAVLEVGGTFTNNGTLDIRGWSGALPSGFINNGTLLSNPPIAINPGSFNDWQAITWPGVTAFEVIGPAADPDNDGRNNLLEWALNLDPKVPDAFTPTFSTNDELIEFTYIRRKISPANTTYQVVWSDSLGDDWTSGHVITDTAVTLSNTSESVRSTLPVGTGGRRFVRVRITQH